LDSAVTPLLKKVLLSGLALTLLAGVFFVQKSLNVDRARLGLTRVEPLENAPPVLAFTTVALGGFRGLISNVLWIRASELQDDDKFFEMAQLGDWITKLEPTYVQVWLVQAWNMAYNISVKFNDYPDRWRWVQRGIQLLRDDGLRFNPNETLIYRELAWFFQHKMGQNLDDAHMLYKREWRREMENVLGKGKPNLDELIHPQTLDQTNRARILREQYKMDPALMKQADELYGPLEWRLPEAHAIYWAAQGLKAAAANPSKIKEEDLITLRRVIYQSMQLSFQRGRLVSNPFAKEEDLEFGPNLDIIPKVSAAYERAANEDKPNHDHILLAHRNMLRDAVYFLYGQNRVADAARWLKYLGEKYPNKILLDGDTNSLPRNVTLEDYAFKRLQEDVGDPKGRDRVKAAIEALLVQSYVSLASGEDERSAGFKLMARLLHRSYESETNTRPEPLKISPLEEIDREMLDRLLDPKEGAPYEMRAALRYKLGQSPEAPATNAPPPKVSGGESKQTNRL
jgi:hypothetical protein